MALTSMTKQCGTLLPPGTKAKLYVTIKGELDAWPQTQEEITLAVPDTPAKGDKKRLGEAWDFSSAASGSGYWREYDVLVDTGQLRTLLEGEIGGNGYRQNVDVFLLGNGPIENEQADDFLAYSGCMIAMIGLKTGDYAVLGDLENPVYLSAAEGQTEARVGFQYTLYANTGKTPSFYDVDTLGVDLTPNP